MLEDSHTDAELVQRVLKKEHMPCIFHLAMTEADFSDALDLFLPDVILADNSLPQFSATEALRVVRQRKLQIPFIMVTGTVSEEFAANIIKSGADDYILKDRLIRLPNAIQAAVKKRQIEIEKGKALEQLVDSEKRYRIFIQRITDAFISLDTNWCYTYLNKQAGDLIRRDPVAMIGKNVWEEFPDAVGSSTYFTFMRAMKEQHYMSNVDYYEPLDLWQENHIYPSKDGLSIFIRDITEKKKLEEQLFEQRRREQLTLTAAVLDAQEKERNAIGVELHDNVNQILVGTNLLLSMIKDNPSKVPELIPYCVTNISNAIEENRKIAHELVTPDLETEGLVFQITRLCNLMLHPAGLRTTLLHETFREPLLNTAQKLTVYRIAQEQCTNIVKYAKAKSVVMTLGIAGRQFYLRIADDGEGMDPEKVSGGIGLQNIRSRASVLHGEVRIETSPGNGFAIEIEFPVENTSIY